MHLRAKVLTVSDGVHHGGHGREPLAGEEEVLVVHHPDDAVDPLSVDRQARVAVLDQVQRVEGVERAVGHSHAEAGREQSRDLRAPQQAR